MITLCPKCKKHKPTLAKGGKECWDCHEQKESIEIWRLIETAPRDGSLFIGYGKFPKSDEYQCFIGHYREGGYTEGWAEKYSGNTIYLTHWSPLPKPPVNNNDGK